jgi:hypothetical protein
LPLGLRHSHPQSCKFTLHRLRRGIALLRVLPGTSKSSLARFQFRLHRLERREKLVGATRKVRQCRLALGKRCPQAAGRARSACSSRSLVISAICERCPGGQSVLASVQSSGGFNRLLPACRAIYRCQRRPEERSWPHTHPVSGECPD